MAAEELRRENDALRKQVDDLRRRLNLRDVSLN